MNFLGLGPGELMVIMVLALIVFGPQKLPEIGAGVGKAIREFRKATSDITQEINRELSIDLNAPAAPRPPAPAVEQPKPEEPRIVGPLDTELAGEHPAPEITEVDASPDSPGLSLRVVEMEGEPATEPALATTEEAGAPAGQSEPAAARIDETEERPGGETAVVNVLPDHEPELPRREPLSGA